LVFFIGTCEILGSFGLVLPALTRVFPCLTPLSALGIALIMILASRFHLKRHETRLAGYTFFLLTLSLFVAYGRFALAPLS
jgi:putative oxidoreductase